jgi:anti-anti-sigma factor
MESLVVSVESNQPGIVRLDGEIDLYTIPRLEAAFAEVLSAGAPVSVDMANVTFIDSSGLHFLARVASSLNGTGPLSLVNVSPRVLRVMEIVGMDALPSIELRNQG